MRWAAVICLLGLACGRIHFDAVHGSDGNDGSDGGTTNEPDARRVDAAPLGPFSAPERIDELSESTEFEDEPSLTADGLEIYFTRGSGPTNAEIWSATRQTTSDAWSAPAPVAELYSTGGENSPEVSSDGLTILFGSGRGNGLGSYDIWMSTRSSRLSAWSVPTPVTELNSSGADISATADASGLYLVLVTSDLNLNASATDMHVSVRGSVNDPWGSPAPLVELNTGAADSGGQPMAGGLRLYFHSSRSGGSGNLDLYLAERPSLDTPFDPPVPIGELNTSSREEDPWLSPDERTIVFSSGGDLYEAGR